jgi:saccharopine dehydrogenase-like NADP-dependent oxidoreductase
MISFGQKVDDRPIRYRFVFMRSILVLGAGRSSSSLISYLLSNAKEYDWFVSIGDLFRAAALERINGSPFGQFVHFDINDDQQSAEAIRTADVVISLLPAQFHPRVARHCLALKKHLLTASYTSEEMAALHAGARENSLLFLNECGLDPGIDHMSAMQIIDDIRYRGGKITSFESFTGGLIAPETDPENQWRYKFTWNPRNVVMAGQGTARFLQNGNLKYIPYQQLFKRITSVDVSGYGKYEGYANRDSLKYVDTYGLSDIRTMLRGTLRNEGFCAAWNILVQLGCCDDTYVLDNAGSLTREDFLNCFLGDQNGKTVREKVCAVFNLGQDSPEIRKLGWSGFFDRELIGMEKGTPAQIVEHILNRKWKLNEGDKDMIVMWHRFYYELHGKQKHIQASLVAKGENSVYTAMAKTVGLPLGIAAKLLINDEISSRGVHIPIIKEFYEPILSELKNQGIELVEREFSV